MFKAFLKDCFRLRLLEFQNVAAKIESRIDEYLIELEKLDKYEKTNSLSENLPPLEQLVKWLEKRDNRTSFRNFEAYLRAHILFIAREGKGSGKIQYDVVCLQSEASVQYDEF